MRSTICSVLALCAAAAPVLAADWPQWGGTVERNMAAEEADIPDTFHPGRKTRTRLGFDPTSARNVRFIARLGSENYSAPVVADGRIYIGTNDEDIDDPRIAPTRGGVLMCLDERSGDLAWRLVVPRLEIDRSKVSEDFDDMNLGICSTATVDGDRVYLVTNRCEVVCLDADGLADGNQGPFTDEASFSVPAGAAPLAAGAATGPAPAILEEVWKFDCNPAGYRSRAGVPIDYWALVRGAKKDLDKDGMLVSPCEVIGTPVIHDGRIYVGIGQDPVHGPGRGALSCIALDGDRGDVTATNRVWQYLGIGRSLSTVSVVDGLVYAAEHAGKVHCLDAKTGNLIWVHDTRDEIWSSTFVVDGKVFIGTRKGLTILRAGREREHVADIRLGTPVWSVPTAANGTLFVASQKNLWAVAGPAE